MQNRMYYSREAEHRAQMEKMAIAWAGILGGLSIGAILALILAPQAGRLTRQQISDGAEQFLEEGRDTGNKVLENVVQGVNKARHAVEHRIKTA